MTKGIGALGGTTPALARRMSLADVGIIYATLPALWITLLPGSRAGVPGRVSLIPLRDLVTMGTFQVAGNLLLATLGLLAPLRCAALASVPRVLALAATCSALIESAQYVLRLDRVSSVDDVLLNTAGAGLAALASHRWWSARRSRSSAGGRSRPVPGRRESPDSSAQVLDLGSKGTATGR